MRPFFLLIIALASCALFQPAAWGQDYVFENGLQGGKITPGEWKMLPVYCIDTQGYKYGRGQSPNAEKWVALMGDTFWHLHHYCLGIVQFNRAQREMYPPELRKGFLNQALGNFQYVIDRMPEHYVLAPEIYTYTGRADLLLGDSRQANEAFANARALKPDYWPAYSWWASYLGDHGHVEDGRKIVADGLAHSPQSRTLQMLKQSLDAKRGGSAADTREK